MFEEEEAQPVASRFQHVLADGRVQCDVCPRFCKMREGQRGFCFAREARGGRIVLSTRGRAGGFCISSIEEKNLHHFLPGSAVLTLGTAGCNLACRFCGRWTRAKARELFARASDASPRGIARAARRLGCDAVALTVNDPTCYHEYAVEIASAARGAGVRTVVATAGFVCPAPRAELYALVDAVDLDLKGFTEGFYRRVLGARLGPVLDTAIFLKTETRVWLEITMPLIPGLNDSSAEIGAMTEWLVAYLGPAVPLHFVAFRPDGKLRGVPETPPEAFRRAARIARENGVLYVYTGGPDSTGSITACPTCGARLIRRHGHALTAWNLGRKPNCPRCDTTIPGVFAKEPGTWQGRLPVNLADLS